MISPYPFHYDQPSVADSGDEIAIQTRLRSRMRSLAPRVRLVATPNGGRDSDWQRLRKIREGMSPGFPDLTAIAEPRLVAFLEIKAKAGSLSSEQINWLNFLHSAGFPCGCFRSVETAVAFLRRHDFPFIDSVAVAA